MKKFQALGGAIVFALTGALIAAPAFARTHHPSSTPQERAQTRDLNLQQLAAAQGQAPANQQAMNANQQPAQPAPAQTEKQNAPSSQGQAGQSNAPAPNAPSNSAPAPATPSDQSTPQAQQPAPSGSQ